MAETPRRHLLYLGISVRRLILLRLLNMPRKLASGVTGLLLFACCLSGLAAQTLQEALQSANIPTERFLLPELRAKITSYAVSKSGPALLGYYDDDGSAGLPPLLHVIRYDRASGELRRAELRDTDTPLRGREGLRNCFGSVLGIRENRGRVFIETHINPSAGCVFYLSAELEFKAALSGWVVGLLGDRYAILRRSEMHFVSVHPMHIEVFDLKQNRLYEVYPYKGDVQRRQFSSLIKPHIVMSWCAEHNAQCDPENFNTELIGKVAVNEQAGVFGFETRVDAGGFGEAAAQHAPPRNVAYLFRERVDLGASGGTWEHREFPASEFRRLFPGMSIQELIGRKPNLAFEPANRK